MGAHLFLVDPVVLALLPGLDLAVLEPEGDLLLGVLDGVAAVADVAADILSRVNPCPARYTMEFRMRYVRWRSHHGWCQARRRAGWWHRGSCGRS